MQVTTVPGVSCLSIIKPKKSIFKQFSGHILFNHEHTLHFTCRLSSFEKDFYVKVTRYPTQRLAAAISDIFALKFYATKSRAGSIILHDSNNCKIFFCYFPFYKQFAVILTHCIAITYLTLSCLCIIYNRIDISLQFIKKGNNITSLADNINQFRKYFNICVRYCMQK